MSKKYALSLSEDNLFQCAINVYYIRQLYDIYILSQTNAIYIILDNYMIYVYYIRQLYDTYILSQTNAIYVYKYI